MRKIVDFRTDSTVAYNAFTLRTKINIPINTFRAVIRGFNNQYADYIIESGHQVELPNGLGITYVEKKKSPPVIEKIVGGVKIRIGRPDWKASKEAGKIIFHKNHHTDNFGLKLKWLPYTSKFVHKDCYKVTYVRQVKRRLCALMKSRDVAKYLDKYIEKI